MIKRNIALAALVAMAGAVVVEPLLVDRLGEAGPAAGEANRAVAGRTAADRGDEKERQQQSRETHCPHLGGGRDIMSRDVPAVFGLEEARRAAYGGLDS